MAGLTADAAGARDRTRLAVTGLLLALAGVAWVTTAVRMAGMESAPGMYPENIAFYASAWVVMMAAMMFPSVWPTVGLYALMQRGRREQGLAAPAGATVTFVGGYLVTWAAAGLVAFALLLLAVTGSGAYLIYQAPHILGEAAFQVALATSLRGAARRVVGFGWTGSLLRSTWISFSIVLAMAGIFGGVAQHYCSKASKIPEVLFACFLCCAAALSSCRL